MPDRRNDRAFAAAFPKASCYGVTAGSALATPCAAALDTPGQLGVAPPACTQARAAVRFGSGFNHDILGQFAGALERRQPTADDADEV